MNCRFRVPTLVLIAAATLWGRASAAVSHCGAEAPSPGWAAESPVLLRTPGLDVRISSESMPVPCDPCEMPGCRLSFCPLSMLVERVAAPLPDVPPRFLEIPAPPGARTSRSLQPPTPPPNPSRSVA